ncbi:MAG TPA: beta-galactosidase, partial [Verrucomicrobiae bacterium]|nr:beta-galactosidase [Verrucomicrobiae bacterium]
DAVSILYRQIAVQMQGEMYKDGGPVIGIQVDNEYGGSPAYLMALKQIAVAAGIDVPFYTKTGWPAMRTPVPLGELLPFFGAYPDGFWERNITPMDGNSWENFTFKLTRTDTGVGNDTLGNRKAGDTSGTEKYPYLTCEIGGGMPASYHRRINYDPRDVEAVALCQLGSGSSLMGYYMYQGGQNPDGKLSTLQESQATGYPNDLPVKNYDFNAPLGEYGQLRPQYFWLRRLHLFLHDFGSTLAPMPLTLPDLVPTNKQDLATLRWAVRSDGRSGYLFVNNYQRLQPMPARTNVQFALDLAGEKLVVPKTPVTVPSDEFFFWPFNLDLGGARLIYATAQPVCWTDDGKVQTYYFAATPGVLSEFSFDPQTLKSSRSEFKNIKPGRMPALTVEAKAGGEIQVVVLSDADSLALEKADAGRGVVFAQPPKLKIIAVKTKSVHPAGPARQIPISTGKWHIAVGPTDAEFTNAAVWQIELPKDLDLSKDPLLRIHYAGDVARVTLDGKLIDDDFYSGRDFEIGLKRYAPAILHGDLRLEILPLPKGAPIYLEPRARPNFGNADDIAQLNSVELVTQSR